jgi:alanyl-tRNA synthetase
VGPGYILRRLISRAVRHGHKLGIEGAFLGELALIVLELYGVPYPELVENREFVLKELAQEEAKFSETLAKGEREFEKMLPNLLKGNSRQISGRTAFKLYDTYGYPIELTKELASEHGFTVDEEGFRKPLRTSGRSRCGSVTAFRVGLADHSDKTTSLAFGNHMLHKSLRTAFGDFRPDRFEHLLERVAALTSSLPLHAAEEIQRVEVMVK